jgi:phosphatidylserine/phosphatidylglycerophosphate/cardiolipin synthase-like enzyme
MTTNYLTFSEPKALRTLDELSNIELRMYCVNGDEDGFHTKGYIFREEEIYRIIVGSSNMTLSALTRNKECNTKIVSTDQGEYAKKIFNEFKELWGKAKLLNEWIDTYTQIYEEQKRITRETKVRYSLEEHHADGIRIVESLLDKIVMRTLQAHVDSYLKDKRPVNVRI